MRSYWRLLCAVMSMVGLFVATGTGTVLLDRSSVAWAADPIPCGPTTTPPDPGEGFCSNYNGDTTWYGTYGPGADNPNGGAFPNALGFGLCAEPPASGGGFPAPDYNYAVGAAPAGAGGDWNALGFAFSQGSAFGWWGGSPGNFTADQAGAAAKILYDTVVWGSSVPSMDGGVLAAYDDFDGWFNQARGMSDGEPELTTSLTSNSTSFTGSATDVIHMQFPGTNRPLVGQGVVLAIANGTFGSAGGPTEAGDLTDANGNLTESVFANGSAAITVTVASESAIGLPGLTFYHPTTGELNAQVLATFSAPTNVGSVQVLSATSTTGVPPTQTPPTPPAATPTGTISVQKGGDDTAYYALSGAVFQISQGGSVVDTLTTDASGATSTSSELSVGTYTVHEATAPAGYGVAPDEVVSVSADQNTVASFTGANEDHITPASLRLRKVDAQTQAPLGGAVFDVRYATVNNGTFNEDLGTCTTGADGSCSPAGNDGGSLLPGTYQLTEVSAPVGYYLNPNTAAQTISLSPGEAGTVTFDDFVLGSLTLQKTGDNTAYTPITGAVFDVTGPGASSASVGTLTVGSSGGSNTLSGLIPGTYTVTETTAPAGYQKVPPLQVAVTEGSAVTTESVLDKVIPATLQLTKVDRQTNAPLAGAVFSVAYDPSGSGTFSVELGDCTTTASGTCTPDGNDGATALLPGKYQVTEITAPSGYAIDASGGTQTVTLVPGQTGALTFGDNLLVPAVFQKSASGNVNPDEVSLAGADLQVRSGSQTGTVVADCVTDGSGACTTASVLRSGSTYCWTEIAAPAGLAAGTEGCFTAENNQAATPIAVADAGLFVAVAAQKVDAADPAATLPGAVFDLYRVDDGKGPGTVPTSPSDAAVIAGETWVARTTTGADGMASFPLQFPGFAYCVVEHAAPANYVLNAKAQCTSVLNGLANVPAAATTLTVADTPQTVAVNAHKFNALVPDTDIPGATYDLYVQGNGPPSASPAVPPVGAPVEANDTWYARATTDSEGNLTFTVPAGYAWCLLEVSAPPDYVLDTGLHCTGILTTAMAAPASTVALPETRGTVHLTAHKFNSLQPDTVIAGATYELLVQGPMPSGFAPATAPNANAVPVGDAYWGDGTTTAQGALVFAVPAGYSWCFHELSAPADYQADPGYHCTAVITMDSPATASAVALPEVPVPGPGPGGGLAFTGGPTWKVPVGGALLIVGGFGLLAFKRRREQDLA